MVDCEYVLFLNLNGLGEQDEMIHSMYCHAKYLLNAVSL